MDAKGLRTTITEIDRITDSRERASNKSFCEETKVGKLRELIPSNIWNFIAQQARTLSTYRELVQLVTNQMTDPKTGMLTGERVPWINNVDDQHNHDPDNLYAMGKGFRGTVTLVENMGTLPKSAKARARALNHQH